MGLFGYIFQSYVEERLPVKIEKINLSIENTVLRKGEISKLQVNILPQEASTQKIAFISSNSKVATVDENGNIKAISAGKSIITVKSLESDVESKIEITVYSVVSQILLEESEIYMQISDNYQINARVLPDDSSEKTILYSTENQEVATINQYGMITAIKEGKTKVIVTSKENSNIKAECILNVVRKLDDSEISFDNSIKIDNMNISGINYENNTVLDLLSKIETILEIEVVNSENKVLIEKDLIGTGCKIRFKENGKILREYVVILYGDANGDGKINSVDLLVIQRDILELELLDAIYRKASNIRKNGNKPSSIDLLLIQRHILNLKIIEQ